MLLIDPYRFVTAAWTPAQITTALWLDAADLTTITTVDSAVAQWNDKSGNGRNAAQSTAGSRPLLTTVNGLPVIQFDGTDDFLSIASAFFPSGAPSGVSFIIGAVAQENSGGFGGVISSNPGGDGNNGCGLLINNDRTYALFPPAGLAITSSTGASRALITGTAAAGTSTLYFNGTLETTKTFSENITNATTTVLGRYRVGDANYGGLDLHELVVAVGTSSSTTRQLLEGYLAWKAGLQANLPAGHPYKNAAP